MTDLTLWESPKPVKTGAHFLPRKAAHQTTIAQVTWAALTMVAYVLPLLVAEVREYVDQHGGSLAAVWSDRLNREAALKVAAALAGIQKGHLPNAKRVGDGFMS